MSTDSANVCHLQFKVEHVDRLDAIPTTRSMRHHFSLDVSVLRYHIATCWFPGSTLPSLIERRQM